MEQDTLDLAPTPQNPAMALYNVWRPLVDYHHGDASIGDRVRVILSDEETGQLTLRCSRYYRNYFSLWPDGTFQLDMHMQDRWRFWENHTFFNIQWALRERVVTIQPRERQGHWWLNARDWHGHAPYLEPGYLRVEARYKLTLSENDWIVQIAPSFLSDGTRWVQESLDSGYAFAQARYERFRKRAANQGKVRAKNPLALRIPGAHLTGDAAVKQMASHLMVFAPRPKEGS
jgi:hypothetical protein